MPLCALVPHIVTQIPIMPRYSYLVTASTVLLVTQLYPCVATAKGVHFNYNKKSQEAALRKKTSASPARLNCASTPYPAFQKSTEALEEYLLWLVPDCVLHSSFIQTRDAYSAGKKPEKSMICAFSYSRGTPV